MFEVMVNAYIKLSTLETQLNHGWSKISCTNWGLVGLTNICRQLPMKVFDNLCETLLWAMFMNCGEVVVKLVQKRY
eukprot:UN02538